MVVVARVDPVADGVSGLDEGDERGPRAAG